MSEPLHDQDVPPSRPGVPAHSTDTRHHAPHTFVVISSLIIGAALLTHLIPAGRYLRVVRQGREVIDPLSFQYVQPHPATLTDIILAYPRGLQVASELVFCFLIIGGALGVVTKTGVVDAMISLCVRSGVGCVGHSSWSSCCSELELGGATVWNSARKPLGSAAGAAR
jgi:uncharacterized ion transporter superfamily protein YfcC